MIDCFKNWNTKLNGQCCFRLLEEEDDERGLFQLLSELTKAPRPSKEAFLTHLEAMASMSLRHVNIVAEKQGKIVAFGTVLITPTLGGLIGKIENIVTCTSVRGRGFGKVLIEILKEIAWINSCKTISLFCEDKNVQFYKKLGFQCSGDIYAHRK